MPDCRHDYFEFAAGKSQPALQDAVFDSYGLDTATKKSDRRFVVIYATLIIKSLYKFPPLDRAADRLSFSLAPGTMRVQLGTNTLKQPVDFGRY